MNIDAHMLNTIKLSISFLLFVFLVRNSFKLAQLGMFISNFRNQLSQYNANPYPHSGVVGDSEVDAEDESLPPKKLGFLIPIEQLVNGFGFNFEPEKLPGIMMDDTFLFSVYLSLILQIAAFILITAFILNIAWPIILCGVCGLVFLLLII